MRVTISAALLAALTACSGVDPSPTPTPLGRAAVALGASPQRGPADAWVTLVEFSDFECPYCASEVPVIKQLLDAYPNDLRLVYKHFTLTQHPDARGAAIAAECAADQGKFWEMHDELFAHQDTLDASHLLGHARAAGIPDLSLWQGCLTTAPPAARVDADMALVQQFGFPGTPTMVMNGDVYFGAFSYGQLQPLIAASLKTAEGSGIPPSEYYDKAVLMH